MKRIVVAMSGGLDSSITAILLNKEGYEVIGVTMAIWDESILSNQSDASGHFRNGCFGPSEKEDIESAKSICKILGIPHHVIDLKKEYNDNVLDYFQEAYASGITPNPCVICNRMIKFGFLPRKIEDMGIDYDFFATGHYVRIFYFADNVYIGKAKDLSKDQSYFLCRLEQNQIRRLMFPLGDMTKKKTRELAVKEGLISLAEQKESQDFIDSSDFTAIFKQRKVVPGKIVDIEGKQIGEHKGIVYYTIGKRRGLNISGLSEPYYVTGIDAEKNIISAGPKSELLKKELIAYDVVWADNRKREGDNRMTAKIRLHHSPAVCSIRYLDNRTYSVKFDEPQLSITPGQIVAFYQDDIILGGGIIGLNNQS